MKKLLKATQALLGILFVALLMPLTSCSNEDELDPADSNSNFSPLSSDEIAPDVATFFEKVYLSEFFSKTEQLNSKDEYRNDLVVINSAADFSKHYRGDLAIPNIDYDKYTLIVGWVYVSSGFKNVVDVSLESRKKYYNLKLQIGFRSDPYIGYVACFTNTYYWRIFPKLSDNKIKIEVIKPSNN